MISDPVLCAAAAAAYVTPADMVFDDVHAVSSVAGDTTIIACRGTVPAILEDWMRDFDCIPREDPQIGTCHRGFLTGARGLLPAVRAMLADGRPYALCGHSLGGALAIALGALLTAEGRPPLRLTTFGAPRVGMAALSQILAPIPGERFRNGRDPVPLVPLLPYFADRGLHQVGQSQPDPIADHAITRYAAALAAA